MKLQNYNWVKGVSYLPSYAINSYEAWASFDADLIHRELSHAKDIGFNIIRTWLNYEAYHENSKVFAEKFEMFLDICKKLSIQAIPILFDNSKTEWDIENPTPDRFKQEYWDVYDAYIQNLVTPHAGDPRILLWETMSEPFTSSIIQLIRELGQSNYTYESLIRSGQSEIVYHILLEQIPSMVPFLKHCYETVKLCDSNASVTIGTSNDLELECVLGSEDVISLHCYEANEEKLQKILENMKHKAETAGKACLLAEWGSSVLSEPFAATTGDQLDYYERILPVVEASNVGWILSSLMIGIEPYSIHSLVHLNGIERPAVRIIRDALQNVR